MSDYLNIEHFKVEEWMNEYENDAVYNLGETCVDSFTLNDLLELAGENPEEYLANLKDLRLTYGHIFGSPELLKGIASLYKDLLPANIIPTHGAIGANHQTIISTVRPSDNVVSFLPTYQQHYSIPRAIGADTRILHLKPEDNFIPNMDRLKSMIDKNTKMIVFTNPNNPTGSWMTLDVLEEIVDIAKRVGAYILADEVYRGISEDGSYMHSIVDIYDKGISTGSMSKIFSLAGLRLGWIASKNEDVIKQCRTRRDYDTISCGTLNDLFSSLALANKEKIFHRNRAILNKNRKILDDWVGETKGVHYVKPVAGTTALLYYDKDIASYDLSIRLIKEKKVLVTPGAAFDMEGCVRIGYAFDSKELRKGLDKLAELLME